MLKAWTKVYFQALIEAEVPAHDAEIIAAAIAREQCQSVPPNERQRLLIEVYQPQVDCLSRPEQG